MRRLILPGFLGLSLLFFTTLRPAQACEANGRLLSTPRAETVLPNLFPEEKHPDDNRAGDVNKQPEITFKTDGNDVLASIQVTANNSPHALSTSYRIGADNIVTLHYTLIQNADRFVRSIKKVTIEWRLKNFAVLPTPLLNYRVEAATLALSAQELNALTTQLQFLSDEPEPTAARIDVAAEAVIIDTKMFDRADRFGECLVNVTKGNGLLGGGKARVVIRNTAKIEKIQDGKRQPASLNDLKVGARIRFSGFRGVAESYPVQVSPAHILILETTELKLRYQGEQ